jgi:DDE family transposase
MSGIGKIKPLFTPSHPPASVHPLPPPAPAGAHAWGGITSQPYQGYLRRVTSTPLAAPWLLGDRPYQARLFAEGHQQMQCPQGKVSLGWKERLDYTGHPYIQVSFRTQDCQACGSRALCTRAAWPASRNWRKIYGKGMHHIKTTTWQPHNLLA